MKPAHLLLALALVPVALAGMACNDRTIGVFNTAPECSILLPSDQAEFETNTVTFQGTVSDVQDPEEELLVRWQTSRQPDAPLSDAPADSAGLTQFTAQGLAPGEHVVTLTVTDSSGETDQDTVTLFVLADPPSVTINEPLTGSLYYAGDPISFRGTVANADETEFDLDVVWASDVAGEFYSNKADASGVTATTHELDAGFHTITLRATDSSGASAADSKVIEVSAFPVGQLDQDGDGWCPDGQDVDDDGECGDNELLGQPGSNDCDDHQPLAYPGAPEVCDGIPDNNCDGILDETDRDQDADTWSPCQGDCADVPTLAVPAPATVFPGNTEVCDGWDNNCDGILLTDEVDADADGWLICAGDCDDTDPAINPAGLEVADDGIDQNCDGTDQVNCFEDLDDDGYGSSVNLPGGDGDCNDPGESAISGDCDDSEAAVHPGAVEICNDWDDNCDGRYNENADPTELGETDTSIPGGYDQYISLADWAQSIAIPIIAPCSGQVCTTGPNGGIQLCRNEASVTGHFASPYDVFDVYVIEYASTLGSLTGCPFTAEMTVPPGHNYGLFVYKTDDITDPPSDWQEVASSDLPGNATESLTFTDFDFGTLFGQAYFVVVVLSNGFNSCPSAGAYNLTLSGF